MSIGLVLEGGAMRGMYTAGVLDIFLDNEIQVDGIVGVSAGVLFGVNYLSKQKGKFVKCPLIKEAPVSIECKVIEEKQYGSHVCFIAEVLSVDADDKYFDENGAFDISKCDLIAYANGEYYTLGKKIGTFGYSVSKKNKTKIENIRKKNLNQEKSINKTLKKTDKRIIKNNNKKVKNNNRKKLKK